MAKRNHHQLHPDDVDVVFDDLIKDLRKRKRVLGHGCINAMIEVDGGGQVTDYVLESNRLTIDDVRRILIEPPRGPR